MIFRRDDGKKITVYSSPVLGGYGVLKEASVFFDDADGGGISLMADNINIPDTESGQFLNGGLQQLGAPAPAPLGIPHGVRDVPPIPRLLGG